MHIQHQACQTMKQECWKSNGMELLFSDAVYLLKDELSTSFEVVYIR
jgi:hypothetical protein